MKTKNQRVLALFITFVMSFSMMGVVFANDNILLISAAPISQADDSIKVLLNDTIIDFTDDNGNKVDPQILNGRTMVPMRKIFEVFGATVEWESETRRITARTEDVTLVLQIDNTEAIYRTIDEEKTITLDSAPVIVGGRTLVPVRFIAESLELNVGWDAATRTVIIIDSSEIVEKIKAEAPTFYEFISQGYTVPDTFEEDIDFTMDLKYTNSEDKTYDTNLKMVIDGTAKKNETMFSVDLTIKITGKGELLDSVKEYGFDKITLSVIADITEMKVYIKSSLIEEEVGSKWAMVSLSETEIEETIGYIFNQNMEEKMDLKQVIDVLLESMELTTETYTNLYNITNMACALLGDEHFKVTGRDTKTYTYELTLKDVMNIIGLDSSSDEAKQVLDMMDAAITYKLKVEDNIPMEANADIEFYMKMEPEEIDVELTGKEKISNVNKTVTISLPRESNIVDVNDLY